MNAIGIQPYTLSLIAHCSDQNILQISVSSCMHELESLLLNLTDVHNSPRFTDSKLAFTKSAKHFVDRREFMHYSG